MYPCYTGPIPIVSDQLKEGYSYLKLVIETDSGKNRQMLRKNRAVELPFSGFRICDTECRIALISLLLSGGPLLLHISGTREKEPLS